MNVYKMSKVNVMVSHLVMTRPLTARRKFMIACLALQDNWSDSCQFNKGNISNLYQVVGLHTLPSIIKTEETD